MNNSLKLENLTFFYPNSKKCIFTNFTKVIEGGSVLFIEGNNGSGKTTLGRLICGLLKPTSGNIFINDTAIHGFASAKKIRYAFYIEQKNQFQFFKTTLKNEIKLSEKISGNYEDYRLYESFYIQEHIETNPLELSVNQAWRFLLFLSTIYDPITLFIDEIPSSSNSKNIIALRNLIRHRSDKNLLTCVSNQRYVQINPGEILQL